MGPRHESVTNLDPPPALAVTELSYGPETSRSTVLVQRSMIPPLGRAGRPVVGGPPGGSVYLKEAICVCGFRPPSYHFTLWRPVLFSL